MAKQTHSSGKPGKRGSSYKGSVWEFVQVEEKRNNSREQWIESRNNNRIWIELSNKIASLDDFGNFAFFVDFTVCFCDGIVMQA